MRTLWRIFLIAGYCFLYVLLPIKILLWRIYLWSSLWSLSKWYSFKKKTYKTAPWFHHVLFTVNQWQSLSPVMWSNIIQSAFISSQIQWLIPKWLQHPVIIFLYTKGWKEEKLETINAITKRWNFCQWNRQRQQAKTAFVSEVV